MASTFPALTPHSFFSLSLVCTLTHAFASLFSLPAPITFYAHILTNYFTVKIGTNFLSTPKPLALDNMSVSRFMLPATSCSSFWKRLSSYLFSVPLTTYSRLAHHPPANMRTWNYVHLFLYWFILCPFFPLNVSSIRAGNMSVLLPTVSLLKYVYFVHRITPNVSIHGGTQ